jgi:hypothetical protein
MFKKCTYFYNWNKSKNAKETSYEKYAQEYDYGRLDYCLKFKSQHPKVMKEKISALDWEDSLRYKGPTAIGRPRAKHEKFKYRLIVLIERIFFGGRVLGGYKNYNLLRR